MNSVKRFPVPSIPGNNTSLGRALDTELMLAGVLALVVHENGICLCCPTPTVRPSGDLPEMRLCRRSVIHSREHKAANRRL
jgi:hypothetical protein